MQKAGTGLLVAGWIFSVLGGLIGLAIAAHIVMGKEKQEDGKQIHKYDEGSRKTGKIMMGVAIAMMVIGGALNAMG